MKPLDLSEARESGASKRGIPGAIIVDDARRDSLSNVGLPFIANGQAVGPIHLPILPDDLSYYADSLSCLQLTRQSQYTRQKRCQMSDVLHAAEGGDSSPKLILLTAREVAARLGFKVRTVYNLHRAGKLPSRFRVGGSYYWRLDEIKQWEADRRYSC